MAFKTIKCPSCGAQVSVRVPDVKSTRSGVSGVAGGGAGVGIIGLMAEFGVEFPGPLSIALVAGIVGMFCQKYAPEVLDMLSNEKR